MTVRELRGVFKVAVRLGNRLYPQGGRGGDGNRNTDAMRHGHKDMSMVGYFEVLSSVSAHLWPSPQDSIVR
jgi:hypothetical protein